MGDGQEKVKNMFAYSDNLKSKSHHLMANHLHILSVMDGQRGYLLKKSTIKKQQDYAGNQLVFADMTG